MGLDSPFGGDFMNSYLQGYQLALQTQRQQEAQKLAEQNLEMNKMLKEEQVMNLRERRTALENAEQFNRQINEKLMPTKTPAQDLSAWSTADEVSGPSQLTTLHIPESQGPSQIAQQISPEFANILRITPPSQRGQLIVEYAKEMAKQRLSGGITPAQKLQYSHEYTPESFNAFAQNPEAPLVPRPKEPTDTSWQSVSVTEKGGYPIWKNPKELTTLVVMPNGTRETYDPAKHGKELTQNVSQTTIFNNSQQQQFKPGTIDYFASMYETTGQIPPFGMGNKGAAQRQAFFDKVAERAIARGEGMDGAKQAVRAATYKSDQSTLTDLTKREQLIKSFDARINETSDKVLEPLIRKWDLQNPRFANWTVNKLAEVMGSGDLGSLKLALNSVSTEVGKVEFNALGIQQLSESTTNFMNKIHDPNMKVSELLKVVGTSKKLTETGMNAITNQRKELLKRMGTNVPGNAAPTTERPLPKF